MGTKLCKSYRIIKARGSISVTNSKEWRIDTTIGRAKDKGRESGKEAKKEIEIDKDI